MCDYPTQLNTASFCKPTNFEETAYSGRGGGRGGGGRHRGGGGHHRHGGGGHRRWHGGGGGRRWHGGSSYYYPSWYPDYSYTYVNPYYYNDWTPYYSPYTSNYYSYTTPVLDVETSSKYGLCVCDSDKPVGNYCAPGYRASCQGGSCTCTNRNEAKVALGDWGCGNSSEVYCPIKK